MFLLVPAHSGSLGQRACKRLCVYVVIRWFSATMHGGAPSPLPVQRGSLPKFACLLSTNAALLPWRHFTALLARYCRVCRRWYSSVMYSSCRPLNPVLTYCFHCTSICSVDVAYGIMFLDYKSDCSSGWKNIATSMLSTSSCCIIGFLLLDCSRSCDRKPLVIGYGQSHMTQFQILWPCHVFGRLKPNTSWGSTY